MFSINALDHSFILMYFLFILFSFSVFLFRNELNKKTLDYLSSKYMLDQDSTVPVVVAIKVAIKSMLYVHGLIALLLCIGIAIELVYGIS